MKFLKLTNPLARCLGAMFRKALGETTLVFEYPHPAKRLFHTAFCPPLRILALDDEGEVIFDRIARPWMWVRIPATRFVVEIDPDVAIDAEALRDMVAASRPERQLAVGSWSREAGLDRLFFALINEAVADIRRVYEANRRKKVLCPNILSRSFLPWERGKILGSAALVLEGAGHVTIPENAVVMSRQVIETEKRIGRTDELLAASIAGYPWKFPKVCFKCTARATWRPVLSCPMAMPVESSWRYSRPENHVPICRRCAYVHGWKQERVRVEIARMLWGVRYAALEAWHSNWQEYDEEGAWDMERFPLWPATYGGDTWALGCGAIEYTAPQGPQDVYRSDEHLQFLEKYFQRKPPTRRYWTSPLPEQLNWEPELAMQGAGA